MSVGRGGLGVAGGAQQAGHAAQRVLRWRVAVGRRERRRPLRVRHVVRAPAGDVEHRDAESGEPADQRSRLGGVVDAEPAARREVEDGEADPDRELGRGRVHAFDHRLEQSGAVGERGTAPPSGTAPGGEELVEEVAVAVLDVEEREALVARERGGPAERGDDLVDLVVVEHRAAVVDAGPGVEVGMGERGATKSVGPAAAVGQLQADQRLGPEHGLGRGDERGAQAADRGCGAPVEEELAGVGPAPGRDGHRLAAPDPRRARAAEVLPPARHELGRRAVGPGVPPLHGLHHPAVHRAEGQGLGERGAVAGAQGGVVAGEVELELGEPGPQGVDVPQRLHPREPRGRLHCAPAYATGEVGAASFLEGGHALDEVARGRRERLVRALEVEGVGEVGLEARVEEALREAQRPRRSRGEPHRERVRLRREVVRRDAAVRQAGGDRVGAGHALAEHHHRLRPREADEPGEQVRPTRVDHEAPLRERPDESRLLVDEHEVARQREVSTRADGHAVHRGDRRLVELPEVAHERLDAHAQRLRRGAGVEALAARLRHRRRRQVHPGAERIGGAGDEHGADRRVGPGLAHGMHDRVAHLDGERVLGLGPVERDPADVVVAGDDVHGHGRCLTGSS